MSDHEKFQITHSEEYKNYLEGLCRLASDYIPRIRRQFAEKAFEMYQNETVRKLVLAYREEALKLDVSRLMDFSMVANDPELYGHGLEDTCLNHARSYHDTIKFLFEIK